MGFSRFWLAGAGILGFLGRDSASNDAASLLWAVFGAFPGGIGACIQRSPALGRVPANPNPSL